MNLRSILVRGFGMLSETGVESLQDGLVLFEGPNGAGKSTFLAFLNSVIFGYERGASTKYAETLGALRGGSVSLETRDGRRLNWDRGSVPPAAGILKVQLNGSLIEIGDLLGSADREMYGSVFALGIDQLRAEGFDADRQSAIEAAITGMGVKGLPAALSAMSKEVTRLNNEVRGAVSRVDEAEAILEKAKSHTRQYDTILEQSRSANGAIAGLNLRVADAKAQSRRLDRMESGWTAWCEHVRTSQLLEASPSAADLEDGSLERLRVAREQESKAKSELAELSREASLLEAAASDVAADSSLLAAKSEIRGLEATLHAVREAEIGLEDRQAALETAKRSFRSVVQDFGPDWDDARIKEIDASLVALTEGGQIAREVAESRQAARQARAEFEARSRDAEDAGRHLNTLSEAGSTEDDRISLEESDRRSDALDRAKALLAQTAKLDGPEMDRNRIWVAVVLVGVVIAVIGIVLRLYWLVAVGVVVGAALGFVLHSSRSPSGEADRKSSDQLAELCKKEGWTITTSQDAEAIQKRIRTARDAAIQQQGRQAQIEAAKSEVRRLQEIGVRLERDVDDSEKRSQAAVARWRDWCSSRGYPKDLDSDSLPQFESRLIRARSAIEEVEKASDAFLLFQTRIVKAREVLGGLFEGLGLPEFTGPVAAGISRLVDGLENAEEADRAIREASKQLEGLRARERTAQRDMAAASASAIELLAKAGVATDIEFEVLYQQSRAAIQVRAENDKANAVLLQVSGPNEFVSLCADLAKVEDGLILAESAKTCRDELKELEAELRAAEDQRVRLEENLRSLEAGGDLGAALADRADRRAELEAIRRKWLEATLARLLLNEAKETYQNQVQSAVLDRASHYMGLLTGGAVAEVKREDSGYFLLAPDGTRRNLGQLNRSQVERLLLAVRFGYIDQYCERREPLPVILDDILVNFDPQHQVLATIAIADFASRHQVLYLTCHPSTVDLFRSCGRPYQHLRLTQWKFEG